MWTQTTGPALFKCWANVCDGCPTLKHHWVNISCALMSGILMARFAHIFAISRRDSALPCSLLHDYQQRMTHQHWASAVWLRPSTLCYLFLILDLVAPGDLFVVNRRLRPPLWPSELLPQMFCCGWAHLRHSTWRQSHNCLQATINQAHQNNLITTRLQTNGHSQSQLTFENYPLNNCHKYDNYWNFTILTCDFTLQNVNKIYLLQK